MLLLAVAWRWSSLEPPRAASTMTVDYTLVRYFKITFFLKNFTLFTAQKVHLKKNERSRAVERDFCCNIHVTRVATFFSALFAPQSIIFHFRLYLRSFAPSFLTWWYSMQVPEFVSIVRNTVPTVSIICLIPKKRTRTVFKKLIAQNWHRLLLENSDWARIATESWHFWHLTPLQRVVVVMDSISDSFRKIEVGHLNQYILDGCIKCWSLLNNKIKTRSSTFCAAAHWPHYFSFAVCSHHPKETLVSK